MESRQRGIWVFHEKGASMVEDFLGTHKIDSSLGTAGIGRIIIPDNIERDEYVANCFRTETISINAGLGYGTFHAVRCNSGILQELKFPKDSTEWGMPVVWVKDEMSGRAVIVSYLHPEGEYDNTTEYQKRFSAYNGLKNVEVVLDSENSTLFVNVLGDAEFPSAMKIKLSSPNKDSEFEVYSDNSVRVSAGDNVSIFSAKNINCVVTDEGDTASEISIDKETISAKLFDEESKEKFSMSYKRGTGLYIKDEFENVIKTQEGSVDVDSRKINLGEGKEKMVLGDTLVDVLNSLVNAIMRITVTTPAGPSVPPLLNVAEFTTIKGKLNTILSNLSNTD